jgi:hypothetical protein
MNVSTDLGVWIGALCTLGLLSFFYKDNPFYKVTESLYVGVVAGHALILGWGNVLNLSIKPALQGEILPLIWLVVGLSLYTRYSKKVAWISRIPTAFMVGVGAGMAVRNTVGSQVVTQIYATLLNPSSLNNILIVLGVVASLSYFFFSWESKGALAIPSKVGRMVMMITFGAAFGNTVMGRMSLLIGRLQYLWGTWLGVMKL